MHASRISPTRKVGIVREDDAENPDDAENTDVSAAAETIADQQVSLLVQQRAQQQGSKTMHRSGKDRFENGIWHATGASQSFGCIVLVNGKLFTPYQADVIAGIGAVEGLGPRTCVELQFFS